MQHVFTREEFETKLSANGDPKMNASLQRGKEVYRMDDQTLRVEEAQALAHKVERILRHSEMIFDQGGYETAIEAAYNAAKLAAKALLLLKPGVELPGTHGGLSQIFGREYVRTGEVPREWSALLSQKLQLRNRVWYDAQTDFTDADARSAIEFARDVLDFLHKRLEALLR